MSKAHGGLLLAFSRWQSEREQAEREEADHQREQSGDQEPAGERDDEGGRAQELRLDETVFPSEHRQPPVRPAPLKAIRSQPEVTDMRDRRVDIWDALRAQGHRIGHVVAKRGTHYVMVDNVPMTLAEARDLASGR